MTHRNRLRSRSVPRSTNAVSQQPALAAVVGPHDDDDVFDHDDDQQRPHDQRERAENSVLAEVAEVDQRLPDGVERGRPDIAKYDAERGERQV
jgi:hypothetical protein